MEEDNNIFELIKGYKQEFRSLLLSAMKDGLAEVAKVVPNQQYIGTYHRWPSLSFNHNGLPTLSSSSFHGPKEYRQCFTSWAGKPLIAEDNIPSFTAFVNFISKRQDLESRFYLKEWEDKDDEHQIDFSKISILSTIKDAIERYAHVYKSFEVDEIRASSIIDPIENYIFCESLEIDIVIPILFIDFEFDRHQICDGIEIRRLDDQFHMARCGIRSYNVSVNDSVLSSATHGLVFKGWEVPNAKNIYHFDILRNLYAYPIDRIDKFFGALRIVTSFDTGYAQIISAANNWIVHCMADLPYVEGVTTRSYPPRLEDYYWNLDCIPKMSVNDVKEVEDIYVKLVEAKENSINIALKRLNNCMVRDNEEDSILDASIALEALLSDDNNREMTHKLAMRVGALSRLSEDFKKSPQQAFEDIKNIYKFRSAIVHGSKSSEKKRVIKINEKNEVPTQSLAVEYLRHLLKILIKIPKYRDPKKIDNELLLGGDKST